MLTKAVTITVDEEWVDQLVKELNTYTQFTDNKEKVINAIKKTAGIKIETKEETLKALKKCAKQDAAKKETKKKTVVKKETPHRKPIRPIPKEETDVPKRAISAYLFYASERRPELKKAEPEFTFADLTKQIAKEWKEMDETEKKPFHKLAERDKARYEREKKATAKKDSLEDSE